MRVDFGTENLKSPQNVWIRVDVVKFLSGKPVTSVLTGYLQFLDGEDQQSYL